MSTETELPIIGRGYYVHIGETGDAIAVAAHGVGPNGGWIGIPIAKMAFPDTHKTREQLNAAAHLFAAAPELVSLLIEIRKWMDADICGPWDAKFISEIDALLAKARGEQP